MAMLAVAMVAAVCGSDPASAESGTSGDDSSGYSGEGGDPIYHAWNRCGMGNNPDGAWENVCAGAGDTLPSRCCDTADASSLPSSKPTFASAGPPHGGW